MKILKTILVGMILTPQICFAAQVKEVREDGEISAFIAQDELSRIKVIGEKIKRIVAIEGDLEILDDKQMGDIYIKTTSSNKQPKSIFIITEKGMTYKATLLPKKMPAEQIFIKNIENSNEPDEAKKTSLADGVINIVKSLRDGSSGPEAREVEELKEYGGLFFTATREIKEGGLVGKVLEFENTSNKKVHLRSEQFKSDGLIAVSIDEAEVLPNERTFVYLVEGGENGAS